MDMSTPERRRDSYRTSVPPIVDLLYLYACPLCFPSIKYTWTMSNSSGKPWPDGPSAPQIPYLVRFEEKTFLVGALLGAILYGTPARVPSPLSAYLCLSGTVIVLFFQCMNALLDPINRSRQGVKWPLVAHTIFLFSCVTVFAGFQLHMQSVSIIDDRGFPGSTVSPPGPVGYQYLLLETAMSLIPCAFALLGGWLADGLLVSFTFDKIVQVPDVGRSSSCTAATLFIPATGLSPFRE